MGKLIRFELRKLFKSRYLYAVMAVSVAFILITGATYSVIKAMAQSGSIDPAADTATSYAFVKGALAGTFSILIGVFVAIAATEDNAMGTTKNIIARGYNRTKIFFAKYLVSFIGVLVISLVTVLMALLYGSLAFGPAGEIADNIFVVIIGQIFGLLAYHALFYAIACGFGKIGPAIAVSLIGPMGLKLILTLVDTMVKIPNASLSDYWIDGLFGNFTGTTNPDLYGRCFGLLIAYFAVSLFIGFMVSRSREY